jgi:ATP-binding cassette subfamily B multidrug efflux pump
VTQESLRQHIGMVTQDTSLLHRSIRENIVFGRPEADDAPSAKRPFAPRRWSFIKELSDQRGRKGLDAHVGDRGVKLSGGQRQRIAIARVMLKNAPILVLDEATSALDSEVEAAIQENLERIDVRQDGDRHCPPAVDDRADGPSDRHGSGPDPGNREAMPN